ncbi:MAG: hypothetical protein ABS81_13235 [Pseudonocardia sp. SCN 72-86]|mgnify:CR=1 FL=1|nr:MAG: hypothetical protein ABS81_13235 [Pseudonocardia sp. SCN 72-86]
MQGLGNEVLAGQRIPVGDDVTLNADVYTPATPGRYPATVSFAAYSSETHTAGIPTGTNEIGSPPVLTDRGYCQVVVERRGMGRHKTRDDVGGTAGSIGPTSSPSRSASPTSTASPR